MSSYESSDKYLFNNALITKKIHVGIQHIGNNIKQTLEKIIASDIEGKCIVEGFVKNGSTKIMTYSSGLISGSMITFEVAYECSICSPVEGMTINCVAKNITKAGIRAETNDSPSPVVIFVARDHHYSTNTLSDVKENDEIVVRVIGQRYELNDKYISIIAELVPSKVRPAYANTNIGSSNIGSSNINRGPAIKASFAKGAVRKPRLILEND